MNHTWASAPRYGKEFAARLVQFAGGDNRKTATRAASPRPQRSQNDLTRSRQRRVASGHGRSSGRTNPDHQHPRWDMTSHAASCRESHAQEFASKDDGEYHRSHGPQLTQGVDYTAHGHPHVQHIASTVSTDPARASCLRAGNDERSCREP